MESIDDILQENRRRTAARNAPFDPITGRGSIGARSLIEVSDFAIARQWVPEEMMRHPLVAKLSEAGSISRFLTDVLGEADSADNRAKTADMLMRLRMRCDFPFWAALLVRIKNKDGGDDVPFRLILLKARQWGGSTTTQIYMAWLQIVHRRGLNSLIIAHQGSATDEIKDMFDRMLASYPPEYLHEFGESWNAADAKLSAVGKSGSTHRLVPRNCKIKIGTAERPDGCRGGDYSLVHLSEVGIWKRTDGKSPEDIVRSACSGILLRPLTMIVMESTANGTGNFFHTEYLAASRPDTASQFDALFIPWHDIEQYSLDFASDDEQRRFARMLLEGRDCRDSQDPRREPGCYLWRLWQLGATLEGINWYCQERAGRNDHAMMASEFPSDDEEAFVHSGEMVFDPHLVNRLEESCRPPAVVGEVIAEADDGDHALDDIRFAEDSQGGLWVWQMPEADNDIADRYLAVVDVGGRTVRSDWSVIAVFDRAPMLSGQPPMVAAQWRGHCDIDLLAWKAARIAAWYDNALLVVESNTIETHDKERHIEGGDQSAFILNQISAVYPNLYARRQSEDEIRQGMPRKYGFHTNVATKPMVISALVKAVREALWSERDRRVLDELRQYERKPNGAYGAIIGHHDDLLMTRAIGLHICFNEMEFPARRPCRSYRTRHRGPVSEAGI